MHRWLVRSLDGIHTGGCPGIDLATIRRWVDATRANPRIRGMAGRQQDLYSLEGRLALATHEPQKALTAFNRAIEASPGPHDADYLFRQFLESMEKK